jgi:hypothetical protein
MYFVLCAGRVTIDEVAFTPESAVRNSNLVSPTTLITTPRILLIL